MSEPTPRFSEIFFELYESLPRQGPGNRACAERAIGMCSDLPPSPRVLDLGCGVGGQTLHLVRLLPGARITALDSHAPSIERLCAVIAARGISDRVQPVVGDMAEPAQRAESFDLVWSEGALYNLGIENALRICRGLLRPGGYVAFTDAVWRRENPPPDLRKSFEADYPTMGRVPDVLAAIGRTGLSLVGHFTLSDEAWWQDFYTPMERGIELLRGKYAGDIEALAALDRMAQEPEMHRRYGDFYAYEFFVARRTTGGPEA